MDNKDLTFEDLIKDEFKGADIYKELAKRVHDLPSINDVTKEMRVEAKKYFWGALFYIKTNIYSVSSF